MLANPLQADNRTEQALEILRTIFGYDSFRGQQADIIQTVAEGNDALVLMPTGGGKSLCYQIPSLMREGVGVVVSPLIALMEDQVTALRQYGVKAGCLNSAMSWDETRATEDAMRRGELDLVYVAPERLTTPRFLELLEQSKIALFALDEAHCVSQWGHDFRPDYLNVTILQERWPNVPRVALTATADAQTKSDIIRRLQLEQAQCFLSSFDRPNLTYHVVPKKSARQQLLSFIKTKHMGDAGIVYCLSRRKVDEVSAWLNREGFHALPYHAGLPAELRAENQSRFINEEGVIMVATIAFGMGIDKPNVRFVGHLDLPKSMEAYYQETGRAGRDGLASNVWMCYGMQDVVMLRQMLNSSEHMSEDQKRIENAKLSSLLGYCETAQCRRQSLLAYFGEDLPKPCGNCDTCLLPVESYDGTIQAQKALSAVYRTGQRFGGGHLVDVLIGNDTPRVEQFGHNNLPTFGVGKELNKQEWQSVYRQLMSAGFLQVNHDNYGAFELTQTAIPVLKGQTEIKLRKDPTNKGLKSMRRSAPQQDLNTNFSDEEHELWEKLRDYRLELAQKNQVPPYVIFHDRTLREMVLERPRTPEAMLNITGIGQSKLARFGDGFLSIIRLYG